MRKERTTTATASVTLVAALLSLGLMVPTASRADTCEIPLFVKQGLNGANVMILADVSGSMNAAIYAFSYDPDINWSGNFSNDATYFVGLDGTYEPKDFNRRWPPSPSAYLVNSDNGESGRYSGNYLNWIYFHASDAERATVPAITRIQILKSIMQAVIERSARLDFGLAVFDYDDGGHILAPCGTDHTLLKATIASLTADTWTPLGESLETVLDYFSDDSAAAPITVPCQYNFTIVVTDGLPTMDRGVSTYLHDADNDGNDPGSCASIGAPYSEYNECSDHFDDVAYYMNHTDLRSDMDGDQNVITYVVGYNENNALMQEAADNGGGLFFHAENAIELYLSIEYAIQDILRRISAGSAVAVVSTEQGTDDRLYRGKFMPIDWDGFLECYTLPYNDGDTAVWEAGELLRQRSGWSRQIFTALGNSPLSFDESNATALMAPMGVATEDEASALINWARGYTMPGLRYRRGWNLGPIVHSTPVVVGPPADYLVSESYQTFYQANENRRKMVYVGANDGMLHGFDANNGEEVWAFVPEFALPSFAVMADSFYCHKYTVDQTVTVKDVQLGGVWRTVLISGGRQGGHSIFALDITDPNNPDMMWQADMPDGKNYTSDVEVTTIHGEAVALVGSGLDTGNMESWLYGYRIEDGVLLGSVLLSSNNAAARNKTTRPVPVDLNLDGQTDLVYIADLLGDLYRFDVNGGEDPDSWSGMKLYDGDEPITADPVAAFGPNGSVYVYFGTGAYLDDNDLLTTDPQVFNCVFDRHEGSTVSRSSMANQTSTISDIGGSDGWYYELNAATGERVTQQAAVIAETVIFTSFAPSIDACVAGGTSYLYQMRYDDGGTAEGQESPSDRMEVLGDGIASYPVVDLSQGNVVVQSSDASIKVQPIAALIQRLTVRSWQENFDHVEEAPADITQGGLQ